MYNRNNAPDAIPYTLNQLNQVIKLKDKIILKSDSDVDKLNFFEENIQCTQQENSLAKSLCEQVELLTKDYSLNKIVLSRLTHSLRPVKEFLKDNVAFNPKDFDREKLLTVINKYV